MLTWDMILIQSIFHDFEKISVVIGITRIIDIIV